MTSRSQSNAISFVTFVGLLGWIIPGSGYFLLGEQKRAIIIFFAILATFCIGLYVGSIGVINPVDSKIPFAGQIMTSPVVIYLGHLTADGSYPVYGRPNEIGQIYTSTAGLLNLLCIINSIHLAFVRKFEPSRRVD